MGQRSWARTIDRTFCHKNYGYSQKTKRLQQRALTLRPALRLAGLGVGQSAEKLGGAEVKIVRKAVEWYAWYLETVVYQELRTTAGLQYGEMLEHIDRFRG